MTYGRDRHAHTRCGLVFFANLLDILWVIWYNRLIIIKLLGDGLRQIMADYKIVRSGRKTLSIEIKQDMSVMIRAPYRASDADIARFAEKNSAWIEKHLALMRDRIRAKEDMPPLEPITKEQVRELADRAASCLPFRTAQLAQRVGVDYGRITVRSQTSRWGSCSSTGSLNFNCLLMLCPTQVVDYVIIHELCHRKHMNHSSAFWQEVHRHCPDYAECKRWLRENGGELIERMKAGKSNFYDKNA